MKKTNSNFKLFSLHKTEEIAYRHATSQERLSALKTANCEERAIDEAERCKITKISRATWNRYARENKVPKPLSGSTKNRWMLSEILAYMYRLSDSSTDTNGNTN
ncbi:helix-turn-helix transcriptional regulator [Rheinheimera texasensis]|uniref:helix-turn-helix transcriptional regulator n=1 Tax=Rheinheimera texasensis TaxID=306205 RepID=UPI0012FEE105|nr:hypothetical protein [Rheinheimera texasensis]